MTNIRNALIQSAGSAGGDKVYVEDVFSTFLYTGNSSVRSIDNNIDLSGEGGLVWIKDRSSAEEHVLEDTVRGATKGLRSNATNGEHTDTSSVTSFDNDGFSLGTGYDYFSTNYSGREYASWTLRKQEGFFDVVTYEGNGSNRTISHNLGCKPGMILIKMYDANGYKWRVWHKSLGANYALCLNDTSEAVNGSASDGFWNSGVPTSSVFSVGTYGQVNNNGNDFVAYLFADGDDSNAQIFGDDGDEAIIKTGSYTGNGNNTGPEITLGFEPQWVLIKRSSASGTEWVIADNMRGMPVTDAASVLYPNLTNAEAANVGQIHPAPTGFKIRQTTGSDLNTNSETYIYVAIRRGPMKEPEAGTDVYTPVRPSASGTFTAVSGFPTDLTINKGPSNGDTTYLGTRLTGVNSLNPADDAAAFSVNFAFDFMNAMTIGGTGDYSAWISWNFRRFPKVFDTVAYTGTGAASGSPHTISHNLTVAPELLICKNTTTAGSHWFVYADTAALGIDRFLQLNLSGNVSNYNGGFKSMTATTFGVCDSNDTNAASFIGLAFASLSGISAVGQITGTGNDLNVTTLGAAARFILIKRIDSSGDWYVFDTVTGIVDGNEAYNFMNSNTGVQTAADYIDPHASGFTITSSAPAGLNASGGTYLYLAFS